MRGLRWVGEYLGIIGCDCRTHEAKPEEEILESCVVVFLEIRVRVQVLVDGLCVITDTADRVCQLVLLPSMSLSSVKYVR